MSFHILWAFLLKFYYIKILWIFIFVILFVTSFLLTTFGNNKKELETELFPEEDDEKKRANSSENLEQEFSKMEENLNQNEKLLKTTINKMNETEEMIQSVENQSRQMHDQHKTFVFGMKSELLNTEKEIKKLHSDIQNLAERRKAIKLNLQMHQQKCQEIVQNCQSNFGFSNLLN